MGAGIEFDRWSQEDLLSPEACLHRRGFRRTGRSSWFHLAFLVCAGLITLPAQSVGRAPFHSAPYAISAKTWLQTWPQSSRRLDRNSQGSRMCPTSVESVVPVQPESSAATWASRRTARTQTPAPVMGPAPANSSKLPTPVRLWLTGRPQAPALLPNGSRLPNTRINTRVSRRQVSQSAEVRGLSVCIFSPEDRRLNCAPGWGRPADLFLSHPGSHDPQFPPKSREAEIHFVSFGKTVYNRLPGLHWEVERAFPMGGDKTTALRAIDYLQRMEDICRRLHHHRLARYYAEGFETMAQLVYGKLPSRWSEFTQAQTAVPHFPAEPSTTSAPRWKRALLARPLRKVIATMERCEKLNHRKIVTVYEILECGHEHALYPGQEPAQRRRCAGCADAKKTVSKAAVEYTARSNRA